MPGQCAKKQNPAQYIRYTPSEQGVGFAGGAKQRIIRMVEVQVDPMEPPRFRTNKKIPRGPPSPPAPVMHSPTRKLTQKEQLEWRIPPAISNWKNPKGLLIIYLIKNSANCGELTFRTIVFSEKCFASNTILKVISTILCLSTNSSRLKVFKIKVIRFDWISVWLLMVVDCNQLTSMKTLQSLPNLFTLLIEKQGKLLK